MNIEERRIVRYRIIASILLLIPIGLICYVFIRSLAAINNESALLFAALGLALIFSILEIILLIKGGKKPLNIYKIAFNENDTLNNIPLIAVIVGTIIGLGLVMLGIIAYFLNDDIKTKINMLVILVVATYLLTNCVCYYLFLILLRKRPLTLKDLSKY